MTRGQAKTRPQAVTADEVRAIVGDISDAALTSVLASGATSAEVLEAHTWLSADDVMGRTLSRPLHGVVAVVCDILEAELEPPDESRDRQPVS